MEALPKFSRYNDDEPSSRQRQYALNADDYMDVGAGRLITPFTSGRAAVMDDDDDDMPIDHDDDDVMLDDEGDEEYDDEALSDLIKKLREEAKAAKSRGRKGKKTTSDEDMDENDDDYNNENRDIDWEKELNDDAIERHLKALTKRTVGNHNVDSDSDDDDDDEDEIDWENDDDEEADYTGVDEFMKKLGIDTESGVQLHHDKAAAEQRKKWLENMSQQGACDYQANPMTVGAKKKWLADLAMDLVNYVSDSDDEEDGGFGGGGTGGGGGGGGIGGGGGRMDDFLHYEVNVKELAREAEQAALLIRNMDADVVNKTAAAAAAAPVRRQQPLRDPSDWQSNKRPQQQQKKAKTPPQRKIIVQKADTAVSASPMSPHMPQRKVVMEKPVPLVPTTNSLKAPATPQLKVVMGQAASPAGQQPAPQTLSSIKPVQRKIIMEKVSSPLQPSPQAVVALQDVRTSIKSTTTISVSAAAVQPAVEARTPSSSNDNSNDERDPSAITAATLSNIKAPFLPPLSSPSSSLQPPTHASTGAAAPPPAMPNIVIPPGYPPYPGYGPKWPWHPHSPHAPAGYRECYFHYMGQAYHQYMAYLKLMAVNGTVPPPPPGSVTAPVKPFEATTTHGVAAASDVVTATATDRPVVPATAPPVVIMSKPVPVATSALPPRDLMVYTKHPSKKREKVKKVPQKERITQIKTGKKHEKFESGRGKIKMVSGSTATNSSKKKMTTSAKSISSKMASMSSNRSVSSMSRKAPEQASVTKKQSHNGATTVAATTAVPAPDQAGCACVIL